MDASFFPSPVGGGLFFLCIFPSPPPEKATSSFFRPLPARFNGPPVPLSSPSPISSRCGQEAV